MLTKEKIHELIDRMPEEFSVDDLFQQVLLLQKVEAAQKEN